MVADDKTRVGASGTGELNVARSRVCYRTGLRRTSFAPLVPQFFCRTRAVLAQAPCLVFWIVIRQTSSGARGSPHAARVEAWRIDNRGVR